MGRILLPEKRSLITRNGSGYCNEGPKSRRRLQLEQDNHPDRHVIVSFTPLDFEVDSLEPTRPARIDQREQTFVPKVLAVTLGTEVEFINSDVEVHNVFSQTPRASFNIGRKQPGISVSQPVERLGVIQLRCNIHCHMNAAILSLKTPYFTKADAQGNYVVDGLPDGRYLMEVYHFDLGNRQKELDIRGGGVRKVEDFYWSRP
jgi:hypothetical protein